MKKVIMTCDICGKELKYQSAKNHYTYMIYKYIDGLYVAQDLCSQCHFKIYDKIEEIKSVLEKERRKK